MKRDPNPVSCPEILKKIAGLHAWVPHMSDDRKCDYVNACTELHPEFEALSGSPYCFTFILRWLEDDRGPQPSISFNCHPRWFPCVSHDDDYHHDHHHIIITFIVIITIGISVTTIVFIRLVLDPSLTTGLRDWERCSTRPRSSL